eukprot:CAMPEP_0119087108 /NCGR_PEP_ID=MMETSP1178-20130426/140465_1 /TAXON_ID=33656 /ORGANISM="unid sp, Strain CCMP2000" /LENGTH=103 /DNA_ID=CAMNT_0007070289 /DNA_START=142 /DNA_END=450 /DNA_ORIENTATION=-
MRPSVLHAVCARSHAASGAQLKGGSGRLMRSRSSESCAPATLTLNRAMLRGTAGSLRSMAASADTGTWPHSYDCSEHAPPSSLMLTPKDASADSHGAGSLLPA